VVVYEANHNSCVRVEEVLSFTNQVHDRAGGYVVLSETATRTPTLKRVALQLHELTRGFIILYIAR
jgi:hypothetical protein